jgi:hypothetical protein
MTELGIALGIVAPYYNLALVVIVVGLFLYLFSLPPRKGVSILPWKYLFAAVIVYIIEELLTILRAAGIITIFEHINGFFELLIIALFVYALLLVNQNA